MLDTSKYVRYTVVYDKTYPVGHFMCVSKAMVVIENHDGCHHRWVHHEHDTVEIGSCKWVKWGQGKKKKIIISVLFIFYWFVQWIVLWKLVSKNDGPLSSYKTCYKSVGPIVCPNSILGTRIYKLFFSNTYYSSKFLSLIKFEVYISDLHLLIVISSNEMLYKVVVCNWILFKQNNLV